MTDLRTDALVHPSGRGRYVKAPVAGPSEVPAEVGERVRQIIDDVRTGGLDAVRRWSERLDGWSPESFLIPAAELEAARHELDPDLLGHIEYAIANVRAFAQHQRGVLGDVDVELAPGVHLGHRLLPVGSVAAYVPGGHYPLIASAIMTCATAAVAGVERIVALAPPRDGSGRPAPAQMVAMHLSGASEVYAVGGVQALAATAFGVEGFGDPVDMLVGAGNAYVTEAKRQLFGTVGIDALAGPTELAILADASADPEIVAIDLLGQAEHGPTSEVVLVTTSEQLAHDVLDQVPRVLESLGTRDIASVAWADRGTIVLCDSDEDAVAVTNWVASEHLEVQTEDPEWWFERLDAYGTVFLGARPTVAFSDKAIGTNHVLPTGRSARYTGGLWVGSFLRALTHQRIDEGRARAVSEATVAISTAEGMLGHAESARRRLTW